MKDLAKVKHFLNVQHQNLILFRIPNESDGFLAVIDYAALCKFTAVLIPSTQHTHFAPHILSHCGIQANG